MPLHRTSSLFTFKTTWTIKDYSRQSSYKHKQKHVHTASCSCYNNDKQLAL